MERVRQPLDVRLVTRVTKSLHDNLLSAARQQLCSPSAITRRALVRELRRRAGIAGARAARIR
jgi:hypothetical protein